MHALNLKLRVYDQGNTAFGSDYEPVLADDEGTPPFSDPTTPPPESKSSLNNDNFQSYKHSKLQNNDDDDDDDDDTDETGGNDSSDTSPENSSDLFSKPCIVISAIFIVGLLGGMIYFAVTSSSYSGDPSFTFSSPCKAPFVAGKKYMVSTTNQWATRAGVQILENGGNAADAAAAIQFALNVVQPQSTSIGGGNFIVYYDAKTKKVVALDGREEAPARFNATSFCKNPACIYDKDCSCDDGNWDFQDIISGGHPVGVPGVIASITRLLSDYGSGKLTLGEIAQPAIKLARDGFPMYAELDMQIQRNAARLKMFDASTKLYFPNNGKSVPVGQNFYNPDLAKTLERIAKEGQSVFYTGEIADDIINTVQAARHPITGLFGVMEKSDLAGYRAVYREPLVASYSPYITALDITPKYNIYGMNMPSSGSASIMMMLNMFESLNFSTYKIGELDFFQRFIDVQDIVFADRNKYMGDADFVDVDTTALLNKNYAKLRTALINTTYSTRTIFGGSIPAGTPYTKTDLPQSHTTPQKGTTHMVVIDEWGNIASMTTTIEENLGSAVVVPGRGFLLNNELTDFNPMPYDPVTKVPYANSPDGTRRKRRTAVHADDRDSVGGKRPLSSMSPTIVFKNGSPFLAIGSPGGSRIIGTVLNGLIYVLNYDMCLSDAIAFPRMISQNYNVTDVELDLVRSDVFKQLQQTGYQVGVVDTPRPLGYLEAAQIYPNGLIGVADSTRLATALAIGK